MSKSTYTFATPANISSVADLAIKSETARLDLINEVTALLDLAVAAKKNKRALQSCFNIFFNSVKVAMYANIEKAIYGTNGDRNDKALQTKEATARRNCRRGIIVDGMQVATDHIGKKCGFNNAGNCEFKKIEAPKANKKAAPSLAVDNTDSDTIEPIVTAVNHKQTIMELLGAMTIAEFDAMVVECKADMLEVKAEAELNQEGQQAG